jgi:hypothetical protein
MGTHTLLVRAYLDGEVKKPGYTLEYDGAPDWKYEPVDEAECERWQAIAADPARVVASLKQTGDWDYDAPPPPPQPYERGYTTQIIAGLTPPEPPYNQYREL